MSAPLCRIFDFGKALIIIYLQQHSDPDYSCTYVVLKTNEDDYNGYGLTFTLGRGNEIGIYIVTIVR